MITKPEEQPKQQKNYNIVNDSNIIKNEDNINRKLHQLLI